MAERAGTGGTPPEDVEDRDPGLARERTDLAWTRTAVSFAALGTAMLRTSAPAGLLVMAIGVAVWGLGQLSGRRGQPAGWPERGRLALLITLATALASLLALALALLVPGHPLL